MLKWWLFEKCRVMSAGSGAAAAAGLAVGIEFLLVFAIFHVPIVPMFETPLPNQDDYTPLLQMRVDGLKQAYRIGENLDFSVVQIAGGGAYPESISIVNLRSGTTVLEFNGTYAGALLFCPIVTNPSEFTMTWHSKDFAESLSLNQTGTYAVVARNMHLVIQKEFTVTDS